MLASLVQLPLAEEWREMDGAAANHLNKSNMGVDVESSTILQ